MNNIYYSFLITILSGLCTLLGIIPCFIKKIRSNNIICSSLAFSAGIMICICIFSLIPESLYLGYHNYINSLIFIIIGFIISYVIDKAVELKINNKLYKLGIISVIAIVLHNVPEGIITFMAYSTNKSLGIKLALAIATHNVSEGISIAIPIYYATKSMKSTFNYTFIGGFSEFFGALLTYLLLINYINNYILSIFLSITAGIMLEISIFELLPNSLSYKKRKTAVTAFALGFIIMLICQFII